ncbi:hypothetical protein SAMN06265218_11943 [Fodinibius sediminis]|uniref:Uncharacterized protein n=1 Tax=Fodinibius sediminis TaxID=1214077 RepID=A0A521EVW4_9BACT|nr:hypothetical protein SAMN06265218_11943 [Fodinibius sediminis]
MKQVSNVFLLPLTTQKVLYKKELIYIRKKGNKQHQHSIRFW